VAGAGGLEDLVIAMCPACGRSLALADRNGRHVASEAHYPHRDASGTVICSPPGLTGRCALTVDVDCEPRSPGRAPLRVVHVAAHRVTRN
jgi:hypothetical protein